MYVPQYFKIYELVPKYIYRPADINLWFLFDERILKTIDILRKQFGPMVVNTWYWGGNSQYRGWRPFNCTVGAKFSQHKFGRAIDLIPQEVSVQEIRVYIKSEHGRLLYKYITCIEDEVPHLHIDCRNYNNLLIIKP